MLIPEPPRRCSDVNPLRDRFQLPDPFAQVGEFDAVAGWAEREVVADLSLMPVTGELEPLEVEPVAPALEPG